MKNKKGPRRAASGPASQGFDPAALAVHADDGGSALPGEKGSPERVSACAFRMGELEAETGIGELPEAEEQALLDEVDPFSILAMLMYLPYLPSEPEIVAQTKVEPAAAQGKLALYGVLSSMFERSLAYEMLILRNFRVAQAAEREQLKRLADGVYFLLSSRSPLTEGEKETLRSDAAEFLAEYEKEAAHPQQQKAQQQKQDQKAQQKAQVLDRQNRMLQMMLKLHQDQGAEVDAAALDEAMATFQELTGKKPA